MKSLLKLISLFTKKEKKELFFLNLLIIVMALFEVVGVGSLGPFMSVATDPGAIGRSPVLSAIYDNLGFSSTSSFIAALGGAFFLVVLFANGITTFVMYWVFRWSNLRAYSLGRRLISHYLHRPYAYFLDKNTSELSKNILSEVGEIVNNAIRPGMELVARGLVSLALLGFLVLRAPVVALAVVAVLGGGHAIVYTAIRGTLTRIGHQQRAHNRERFKAATEAFGALKDVKILGKEGAFVRRYSFAAKAYAWNLAHRQILTMLPHYIIQAIAIGLLVSVVVILSGSSGGIGSAVPLITVYAFAAYRMMPSLQVVFRSIAQMRASLPVVDAMVSEFSSVRSDSGAAESSHGTSSPSTAPNFRNGIELSGISFSYEGSPIPVLEDLTLSIQKNTTVALVGPSGCGKTTLVDIILGLIQADGCISIDGVQAMHMGASRWRRLFGYVPQQIFLSDDTVERNIAFGVEESQIDRAAVRRAARIAHVSELIETELPAGYQTIVGERGIRLSGGQKQRIGIARALYDDPQVLVLDEATSALDNRTEEAVMDAIHELSGEKTIILIAHRLSTVEESDVIHFMRSGKVIASGSFNDLLYSNEEFRRLAKA